MKSNKSVNKFATKMIFQMIGIILISLVFSYVTLYILLKVLITLEIISFIPKNPRFISANLSLIFIIIVSLLLGIIISIYLIRRFLNPINELKKITTKVANGNFNVQITNIPQNEMGELIKNFNVMVSELQKNETLKSDFISNVSHEFKTPLATIQGYATLLQDETLSEDEKNKYVNNIIQSTVKLTSLVNNILKITKIDNQKISIEKNYFKLDEQIRESILLFEKEWTNKNIEFDINLDALSIHADKELLSNVWNNLIGNAIKYSNENSTIKVSLNQEDDFVVFIIKDNGQGIPEESIPYIFDKFYQADSSHSSEGNGLGLALVKKIVSLSNGSVSVSSKLNEGSTFTIKLPIET